MMKGVDALFEWLQICALQIENILRDSHGNYLLCDYGSCTVKPMHPEVLGAALCEEQIAKYGY